MKNIMIIKIFENNNSQKGQALLFVVVAVTIALAVGVSVSTRTINSSNRVARTDSSMRVNAAAEGGIEQLLGYTETKLNSMVAAGNPEEITFNSPINDGIKEKAQLTVSKFSTNGEANGSSNDYPAYWFNIDPGYVKELYTDGYIGTLIVCWKGDSAAIYYLSYNSGGEIKKGGFIKNGGPTDTSNYSGNFESVTSDSTYGDYSACGSLDLSTTGNSKVVGNAYGIRFRSLFSSAQVTIIPSTLTGFPEQGYQLTSKGMLYTGNTLQETRTITVYKSRPYASSIVDQGVYSETGGL